MASPTGVIREELMYPQKKQEVIDFLLAAPLPGRLKRNILQGWAMTVGVAIRAFEYRKVEASGNDQ